MTYGLLAEALGDVAPGRGVAVLEADALGPGSFAQKWSKARLSAGITR